MESRSFKLLLAICVFLSFSASCYVDELPLPLPPKVYAGEDQTIVLPANAVKLAGSGTDEDGTIVHFQWSCTWGPSTYTIVNATATETEVKDLGPGVYIFELKATDNDWLTGYDYVTITVHGIPGEGDSCAGCWDY